MEKLANVRIVIWEGASLWIVDPAADRSVESRRTDFHAHHAIQITLELSGSFRLYTSSGATGSGAVAVAADVPHAFEPEGLACIIFVEPESRAGRAITKRLLGSSELCTIPEEIFKGMRERLVANHGVSARSDAQLIEIGRDLILSLGADSSVAPIDPRIRKTIVWAARQMESPLSLSDALQVSGLSAGRLRHLFVEQTGLPFKTYVLWLRLTHAVGRIAAGVPLTQVAHDAGFSDSAHLSRTFRRMFGVMPSALRMV